MAFTSHPHHKPNDRPTKLTISEIQAIAGLIDHAVLHPTAGLKELQQGIAIARVNRIAALCVKPSHVAARQAFPIHAFQPFTHLQILSVTPSDTIFLLTSLALVPAAT